MLQTIKSHFKEDFLEKKNTSQKIVKKKIQCSNHIIMAVTWKYGNLKNIFPFILNINRDFKCNLSDFRKKKQLKQTFFKLKKLKHNFGLTNFHTKSR